MLRIAFAKLIVLIVACVVAQPAISAVSNADPWTTSVKVVISEQFASDVPVAAARTQLLEHAKQRAIRQAVNQLPFFRTDEVENALIPMTDTDRYVIKSDILAENLEGESKSVTLQVQIQLDRLVGALALQGLAHFQKTFSVDVVVYETIVDLDLPDPAAESAIINALKKSGIKVRTSSHASPTTFLACGEAVSEVRKGIVGEEIYSGRARVEIPILDKSRETMCVLVEHASAADISPGIAGKRSLEAAGKLAGERLCGILLLTSCTPKGGKRP